jgi:hypothetical protein
MNEQVFIRVCPTDMEGEGSGLVDEAKLLLALKYFAVGRLDLRSIDLVDVGVWPRQRHTLAMVDGDPEAGDEMLQEFWGHHIYNDPALWVEGLAR